MMSIKIEIKNAGLGYGKKPVLSNVNFEMSTGEVVCLLGPNGAGKTTLFKTLLGFLKPFSGEILVNGKSVKKWRQREFAHIMGYVPQVHHTPFPYTVTEVVLFGRTAHLGFMNSPGREDRLIASECIDMIGIGHIRDCPFTQLSGGERQLTVIARALAQKPAFLVMDEPTSNLDFGNQVKVLKKINELKNSSRGIFISTHSPDHAFLLNSKVVTLNDGKLLRSGMSDDIITAGMMKQVYGVDVMVLNHEGLSGTARKICVPVL